MAEVNARSLTRNSVYAWVTQMWQIGSRFVITPVIIAQVGLAGYGTWALLFGICAYVSIFDTSFGFAYMKFTAEYDTKKDYRGLSEIISSGVTLISGVGLLSLTVLWIVRGSVLRILNVPPELLTSAQTALMIVATVSVLRMSVGSVYQVLAGLQRLDLQYKLSMIASAVEFAIALTLLWLGYGLLGLACGHFVGQSTGIIGGRVLCWRLCPGLKISPFRFSRQGLRAVASLGGRFQMLAFMNMAVEQSLRMLISGVVGVSYLALFELADKLISLGKTVSASLIAPLMPAFAHLHASDDRERENSLYMQVSKLVAATAMVSLGFIFVFGDRLITMWTGQEYPLAAWTIRVLVSAHYLSLLTGVGTASLRGRGTLRLEFLYVLVCDAVVALCVVPAVYWGGYRAIILTMAAAQGGGAMWFLVVFARREGLDVRRFCREVLSRTTFIGMVATGLAFGLRPVLFPLTVLWAQRWSAVLDVAVGMVLFGVLAGAATWYGVFTGQERRELIRYLLRKGVEARPAPASTTLSPQ